jgi:hypothetical protein
MIDGAVLVIGGGVQDGYWMGSCGSFEGKLNFNDISIHVLGGFLPMGG